MKWVTRERPKIDRLGCPWLIRRFLDPGAEIHYVPATQVLALAASAIAFDVPGVELTHSGQRNGRHPQALLAEACR